jgi:hypothetical protein
VTLIGKFPAAVQGNRDLANLFRFYEREVRFYQVNRTSPSAP